MNNVCAAVALSTTCQSAHLIFPISLATYAVYIYLELLVTKCYGVLFVFKVMTYSIIKTSMCAINAHSIFLYHLNLMPTCTFSCVSTGTFFWFAVMCYCKWAMWKGK